MSFQVRLIDILARYKRLACAVAVLAAAVTVPVIVIADGGFYSQTAHGSSTAGVQRDMSLPVGSCAQCHTSHGQSPQDFGLWTASDNSLCFTCHANNLRSYFGQTTFSMSGHSVSASSYNGRPVGSCVQCHNPHGAGDSGGAFPHLVGAPEEQVCFTCHGTGFRPQGAMDIQSLVTKRYAHQVGSFQRKHDDTSEMAGISYNPNPLMSGSGRHVECADCHNSHYLRSTPRQDRISNIGQMQLGAWGVRPVYSGAPWQPPTSYVIEQFQDTTTQYEYYLCFKCHSNWAWGNSAPYTADGVQQTNQAIEFNPANPSYHNVTGQPSTSVPAEFGGAYVNSWARDSAMACSDCHASDPTSTVRGPHGSTYNFMLKMPFQATYGIPGNTGTTGTQSHLCFACHDWNTYSVSGSGNQTNFRKDNENLHHESRHGTTNGCFQCHSAVPHGYKRKHMIVYVSDGPPYFIGGTRGIQSYTHANAGSYSKSNCSTTGSGCHGH